MKPHLRYLRYVLIHKLYVFMAGMAIARHLNRTQSWPRTVWRYLVHDLSKFRPSEWTPYVNNFYGEKEEAFALRRAGEIKDARLKAADAAGDGLNARFAEGGPPTYALAQAREEAASRTRTLRALFDRAWLLHQHRNPHHWQHWILREDSGTTKVLIPEGWYVDEMVADWIGAGIKVLAWPTLAEAVGATVAWYVANREKIVMRDVARTRVEVLLRDLAAIYGLMDVAFEQRARLSIPMPGVIVKRPIEPVI
jgi:hypothetical protein